MDGSLIAQKQLLDERGFSDPIALDEPTNNSAHVLQTRQLIIDNRQWPFTPSDIAPFFHCSNISQMVASCLGNQAQIWRARGFRKAAGDPVVPWHHDKHFQSPDNVQLEFDETEAHLSIYIAFDEITKGNGALTFLGGTHRNIDGFDRDARPFASKTLEEHLNPSLPDWVLERSITLPMPALHFIVFHSAIFHMSEAFTHGSARSALAIRLVKSSAFLSPEMQADAVRVFED